MVLFLRCDKAGASVRKWIGTGSKQQSHRICGGCETDAAGVRQECGADKGRSSKTAQPVMAMPLPFLYIRTAAKIIQPSNTCSSQHKAKKYVNYAYTACMAAFSLTAISSTSASSMIRGGTNRMMQAPALISTSLCSSRALDTMGPTGPVNSRP